MKTQSLVPFNMSEIQELALSAEKSGYYQLNMPQAMMKIQLGIEYGFGPAQSLSLVQVIQGKPTVSAGAMAAMVKASRKYDYRVLRWDHQQCVLEFWADEGIAGISSFTLDDAKQAELLTGPNARTWKKFTRNMLFARAISNGVRVFCPDIGAGLYSTEEMNDVEESPSYQRDTQRDRRKVIPTDANGNYLPSKEPETLTIQTEVTAQQNFKAPIAPKPEVLSVDAHQAAQQEFNAVLDNATVLPAEQIEASKIESNLVQMHKDSNSYPPLEPSVKERIDYLDSIVRELKEVGLSIESLLMSEGVLYGFDDIGEVGTSTLKAALIQIKHWKEMDIERKADATLSKMKNVFASAKNLADLQQSWKNWIEVIRTNSPLFKLRAVEEKNAVKYALLEKEKAEQEEPVEPAKLAEPANQEATTPSKEENPEKKKSGSVKGKWEKANAALHAKAEELGYGHDSQDPHSNIKEIFDVPGSMADCTVPQLNKMRKALEADGIIEDKMIALSQIIESASLPGTTTEQVNALFSTCDDWPERIKHLAYKYHQRIIEVGDQYEPSEAGERETAPKSV